MSDVDYVCTDACPDTCEHCRPVDYDRLALKRAAEQRRMHGGPGRPAWYEGGGMDPAAVSSRGGRVTPSGMSEY